MKMKKVLALIVATGMTAALLASCGSKGKEDANGSGDGDYLIMATEAGFAPYEYVDGDEVVGIDVEIAKEIAKEMGKELKIQDMDFTAALTSVQQGQADFAAAGISITPERQEQMDFSIEYATSTQVIVVKTGDTSIASEEDLSNKVVGVQTGTTGDLVYGDPENAVQPKELKQYKKYTQAAADLKNGKIDCIVMDELPAQLLVEANEGLEISSTELFTDSYGLAIKKGNTELKETIDKVLQRLIDEGKIQEYTEKYSKEAL